MPRIVVEGQADNMQQGRVLRLINNKLSDLRLLAADNFEDENRLSRVLLHLRRSAAQARSVGMDNIADSIRELDRAIDLHTKVMPFEDAARRDAAKQNSISAIDSVSEVIGNHPAYKARRR